jgi:Protein of unknown function (DUF3040)
MSLDDREQQILAEIERQFYQEDPDLAHAVRNIDRSGRFGVRLPAVGALLGATIVVLSFTFSTWLALAGFGLLVLSTTAFVHGLRSRSGTRPPAPAEEPEGRANLWRRFRKG